ncbi:hypothetical protein ACB092_12G168700 [Castanea dentata]
MVESLLAVGLTTTGMKLWETIKLKSPDILLEPKMMDELGQRKMNRDQALSTTYSTILKIHKKVVGRRSPGSIGPAATKDVEKKIGGSNSEEDEKEDTYKSPSFDDY